MSLNLRRFESSLVDIQNSYRTRIIWTSWQHFVVVEKQNLLVWEWEILKAPQHLGLLSTVSTSLTISPKTHVFGSSYILQNSRFSKDTVFSYYSLPCYWGKRPKLSPFGSLLLISDQSVILRKKKEKDRRLMDGGGHEGTEWELLKTTIAHKQT